jgi:hypothetical protein
MKLYDRSQQPITDWRQWTRPKEDLQWRASRSAMELARAWFISPVPVVPREITDLLASHDLTRNAELQEGWPEFKTALPVRGEARNHDLVLVGNVGGRRILVAVEGKVDETMGPAIGTYWQKSKRTQRSGAWRRIDTLLRSAFGPDAVAVQKPWNSLPYQMLTATVGAAIEAQRRSCDVAVVCVHELITDSARAALLDRNRTAFQQFVGALGESSVVTGKLYGPFKVAVEKTIPVPVLVGKAQYRWAGP